MPVLPARLIVLGMLVSFLLSAEATAGGTDASRLLDEVVKTYKTLTYYEDHGEIQYTRIDLEAATSPKQAKMEDFENRAHLRFARPDKFDLDFGGYPRFVSDGRVAMTVVAPYYSSSPGPGVIRPSMFRGTPLDWHPRCRTYYHHHGNILLSLLLEDDPAKIILSIAGGPIELEADRIQDGERLKSILLRGKLIKKSVLDVGGGRRTPDIRLLVDPNSKLLVRIEFDFLPQIGDPMDSLEVDGKDVFLNIQPIGKVVWIAGKVSIDPVKVDPFDSRPPYGFAAVDEITNPFDGLNRKRR